MSFKFGNIASPLCSFCYLKVERLHIICSTNSVTQLFCDIVRRVIFLFPFNYLLVILFVLFVCLFVCFAAAFVIVVAVADSLPFAFLFKGKLYFSISWSIIFLKTTWDSVLELFVYSILCEYRISIFWQFSSCMRISRCGLCFEKYLQQVSLMAKLTAKSKDNDNV